MEREREGERERERECLESEAEVGEEVAELGGDEGRDVFGRCSHGCV